MKLGAYGASVVQDIAAPYFGIDACSTDDKPTPVTTTKVEADEVSGTSSPVKFAVAFPNDAGVERVISARQPIPDGYVDVAGATGDLEPCDGRAVRQAAFVVAFPQPLDEPVRVVGVTVTYEVDGDEYTATSDVDLTACPPGTRTTSDERRCAPRRRK